MAGLVGAAVAVTVTGTPPSRLHEINTREAAPMTDQMSNDFLGSIFLPPSVTPYRQNTNHKQSRGFQIFEKRETLVKKIIA
jgi:hypothetical protein